MSTLLVVHHTVSPHTQEVLEACLDGAAQVDDVTVRAVPALTAAALDVLTADAVLVLTTVNIGALAGATKHFFDQIYYPCLQSTRGRPWALVVHGGDDTTGAVRAAERIALGLSWRPVRPALSVTGSLTAADREACADQAGVLALSAAGGSGPPG